MEPSPRKLWNSRNLRITMQWCPLGKTCGKLRVVAAERRPAHEEVVHGDDVEGVASLDQVTRHPTGCAVDDRPVRQNPQLSGFHAVPLHEHSFVLSIRACHAVPPSRSMHHPFWFSARPWPYTQKISRWPDVSSTSVHRQWTCRHENLRVMDSRRVLRAAAAGDVSGCPLLCPTQTADGVNLALQQAVGRGRTLRVWLRIGMSGKTDAMPLRTREESVTCK